MSGYNEKIDEKYAIIVENGTVQVTRYGEQWLTNPPGSKARIAAADVIEQARLKTSELPETSERAETLQQKLTATQIAEHLSAVWGWVPGEPEALMLGENLAAVLDSVVVGTNTNVNTLLTALLQPVKDKNSRLF